MKWNCNIVKEMYDRVIRRKFGLLCSDDTSNKNFINAYLNTLDCNPINLQCLKGEELPCDETDPGIISVCNLSVTLSYSIQTIDGQVQYVFTATPANGTAPYEYAWQYESTNNWSFVSGPPFGVLTLNGNVLVLSPINPLPVVNEPIAVVVRDANGCQAILITPISYEGGCTDPEAVNYNPDATFDNGTCYYNELVIASSLECEVDDTATLCITANGGVPPYSVMGTPSGTILVDGGTLCQNLANGSAYSYYVVDANGTISAVDRGVVSCPFDCNTVTILPNLTTTCVLNGLGVNSGAAIVNFAPSGGNAPYTVTATVNGIPTSPFTSGVTVVTHGDVIIITATDNNGCVGIQEFIVNCPQPVEALTCVDLEGLNISASLEVISNLNLPGLRRQSYEISLQFTNLGTFGLTYADINSVDYTILNVSNFPDPLLTHAAALTPGTLCNPCTGSYIPTGVGETLPAYIGMWTGQCNGVDSYTIIVDLSITVNLTIGGLPCVVCFERTISGQWFCAGPNSPGTSESMINVPCVT